MAKAGPEDPNLSADREPLRTPDADALHNDVIHLVYAMVSDPSHLQALGRLVTKRVTELYAQDDEALSNPPSARFDRFAEWRTHMNNALGLLEQQGRNQGTSGNRRSSGEALEEELAASAAPGMLVDVSGHVLHANAAALALPMVALGASLQPESFSEDGYEALRGALVEISHGDYRAGSCIVQMQQAAIDGSRRWIQMALTEETRPDGRPVGKLMAVEVVWDDEVGRDFERAFGLTPTEFEVARAIILGIPLADLAKLRERSLGTVRLQSKQLLKKLSLRSQIELARLFSGFRRLGSGTAVAGAPFQRKIIARPNGGQAEVRIFGPEDGQPILFFHDTLYGLRLPSAVVDELDGRGLRLVCICRPGFAGSTACSTDENTTRRLADENLAILNRLGIDACPALAHIGGLLHALAFAARAPSSITSLTAASGIAPLLTKTAIDRVEPLVRSLILMTRYTPELLPYLMRARMAETDALPAKAYLADHAGDSPADLSLLEDEAITATLDWSRRDALRQGSRNYAEEVLRVYGDWTVALPGHALPVALVHGDEDAIYPPETVEAFRKILPNARRVPVADAGHLLFYQNPAVVFDALETLERGR